MAEETEQQEEKKEKKSNLLLIIIAGVFLLILVVGGLLAFVLSGGSNEEQEMMQNGSTTVGAGGGETQSFAQSRRKSSINVGPMFEMETFIVNLKSENGRRYLKIRVNLELEDLDLQEEVTQKIPVIRDIVIRIASSRTLEEISTEQGKDKLKDQIVSEINGNLKDGKINNIFFTDFVIQ
jgi:flagellar FliL protein